MTVKVGNDTFNAAVVNGTAVVNLTNVTPGVHEVEVIYSGDGNHNGTSINSTVVIPKLVTPISVDVSNIGVGDTAHITVNVPANATGNVTIEIDGVEHTAKIDGGKAVFDVGNLTAGTKTIAVNYIGDNNYTGNHTTANITVSKLTSNVKAEISDINASENVTVTVHLPKDATGQVLIDIGGVGYYVNVTKGEGSIEIPRIPSGKYDVNITYTGDDKYMPCSNKTSFNVSKMESFVIPTAQDIMVGENEVINLLVPKNATGTVTVVINGTVYNFNLDDILGAGSGDDKYSVAVSHGKGILVISGLPKGEYVVSVRYNGDDNYKASVNSTKFTVSNNKVDVKVDDLGNGTVIVNVPDDAKGNVTLEIENQTYVVPVENGRAVVNLENVTLGKHNVTVKYSGDDKYPSKTVNSTVTVPKYPAPIRVSVDDIHVGDTAVVTVTLPDGATGDVTIEINGVSYSTAIKDGKAVFNVKGLGAGNKTVAVKYGGDDSYCDNYTTAQFEVTKVAPAISAKGSNIQAGRDEIIDVVLPGDATGQVLVEINGVGYYAYIIKGKAKVVVPNLPAGKYTAKVYYDGDDKYLRSSVVEVPFTVSKVKSSISASDDYIEVGENATITVNQPSDAKGSVKITVNGKSYKKPVINGKAVFIIPGLDKGVYTVKVYYSGDDKYEGNYTVAKIVVEGRSDDKNESRHSGGEGVSLSEHPTGNPILILLLIILVLGSAQLRRLKK